MRWRKFLSVVLTVLSFAICIVLSEFSESPGLFGCASSGPTNAEIAEEEARQSAYDSGYKSGYEEGRSSGLTSGYSSGYEEGHEEGYRSGYSAGFEDSRHQVLEYLYDPLYEGYGVELDCYFDILPDLP